MRPNPYGIGQETKAKKGAGVKRKGIVLAVAAFMAFTALLFVAAGCSGGGGGSSSGSVSTSDPATQEEQAQQPYRPPHGKPGPAVDKIQFGAKGVDQAVPSLRNDQIDLYVFGLKITAAREIEGAKDLRVYRAPAGQVSIILNPAPARSGSLNPFSILEVRRAMNYLIDRQFIAGDIYGGYAVAQESHVSPLDFDYLTVADVIAKQNIRYDLDYAKRTIAAAMERAGAELVNGKWHYNGQPVRLKFVIRVEDERRDVGDAVRTNLEAVGFEVSYVYLEFAGAISKVYTSDPQAFEWHLYTEGWGRGSAERYDYGTINGMAAPWMANMPGWQILGFWQYENARLDEIGKKLFTGDFASQEERDALYREATELAMKEAVRLWVVTTYNTFPAKKDLVGVTEDLVSGPKSILALREAYRPGSSVLRVGNLNVWTERSVWNPVGGFGDVYSIDVWKNLVDPAIINDPFRGVPIPFRAGFSVETAGPTGKIVLPQDAVMWNAGTDRWDPIGSGVEATSKVVFDFSKYFQSKWHDGSPITMADVLYGIASSFDRVYDPKKQQIEFVLAATQKPILDVFRGFRVLDANRIEVYLDYWHFEESYIASYANVGAPSFPWEVMAAMDELVFQKRMAAYSQSSSLRYNVEWISLVEKSDAVLVANVLKEFVRTGFVPESIRQYATAADAKSRYEDALQWFDDYEHLVISNGPFFLARYEPSAQYAEIQAFRDATYPFKPGDWYRERPAPITFVNVDAPRIDLAQENAITVSLDGPGVMELRYVIEDPSAGTVEAVGVAVQDASGNFRIVLDPAVLERLRGKILEIVLLAASDELALVSEERVQIPVP